MLCTNKISYSQNNPSTQPTQQPFFIDKSVPTKHFQNTAKPTSQPTQFPTNYPTNYLTNAYSIKPTNGLGLTPTTRKPTHYKPTKVNIPPVSSFSGVLTLSPTIELLSHANIENSFQPTSEYTQTLTNGVVTSIPSTKLQNIAQETLVSSPPGPMLDSAMMTAIIAISALVLLMIICWIFVCCRNRTVEQSNEETKNIETWISKSENTSIEVALPVATVVSVSSRGSIAAHVI